MSLSPQSFAPFESIIPTDPAEFKPFHSVMFFLICDQSSIKSKIPCQTVSFDKASLKRDLISLFETKNHGKRGNCPKSGFLFSLKASLPSFASSVV